MMPAPPPPPPPSARDWLALKAEKESFVSNLEGTTKREVFFIVMTLPLCALVASDLNAWLNPGPFLTFIIELTLLAGPQIALTMASPPLPPAAPCFAAALALWLLLLVARRFRGTSAIGRQRAASAALVALSGGPGGERQEEEEEAATPPPPPPHPRRRRLLFVSAFRGGLMLLTCASILAVDFRAFPRRLAKAENYGQGLMDVGVGAFVFAAGLVMRGSPAAEAADAPLREEEEEEEEEEQVGGGAGADSGSGGGGTTKGTTLRRSARVPDKQQQQKQRREGQDAATTAARPKQKPSAATTTTARLTKSLRASFPVAALGLIRLLTTKAAQYAEHVGEYGVHWNFFLTVAAVGAFAAALPPRATAAPGRAGLLSALLLSAHQALLSLSPLGAWVQAEARGPGWVSLNKEGLASLPGYLSLLLLGAGVGGALRAACDEAAADVNVVVGKGRGGGGRGRKREAAFVVLCRLFAKASLASAALWLAALVVDARVERVSRRACNAAYALWVSALCVSTLLACMAGEAAVVVMADNGGGKKRRQRAQPPQPQRSFAPLLCALNRNMLAVFLGANLLTGAVNLLTDTLSASDTRARLTVGMYLLLVGGGAAALDAAGVDTTRWLMR